MNANDNDNDIDKPQVCQNRGKINEQLLVSLQSLYINTRMKKLLLVV